MTGNFAVNGEFNAIVGILYMPQISDMGTTLYFPSERRHAEDYFVLKNRTASVGFEHANLGVQRPARYCYTTVAAYV
jgi:hypothetical protein